MLMEPEQRVIFGDSIETQDEEINSYLLFNACNSRKKGKHLGSNACG